MLLHQHLACRMAPIVFLWYSFYPQPCCHMGRMMMNFATKHSLTRHKDTGCALLLRINKVSGSWVCCLSAWWRDRGYPKLWIDLPLTGTTWLCARTRQSRDVWPTVLKWLAAIGSFCHRKLCFGSCYANGIGHPLPNKNHHWLFLSHYSTDCKVLLVIYGAADTAVFPIMPLFRC